MLPLSYTISSELKDTLRHIDELRTTILTFPLSGALELALRWEAKVKRIQGSLALADIKLNRREITTALTGSYKTSVVVHGYRRGLDWIEDTWTAHVRAVGPSVLETLISYAYVGPLSSHKRTISPTSKPVRQLLDYLENQTEHPVIHAGIALGILSGIILAADDPGLVSRLLAVLFLAKDGYDLRGMASVESEWAKQAASYHVALSTVRIEGNLNHWLLFVAQSVEANFTALVQEIAAPMSHRDTVKLWHLFDRQRAILHLLDDPETTITNKIVQKKFNVSQITASRDLTKLLNSGLLLSHGKGRSVSYTRI